MLHKTLITTLLLTFASDAAEIQCETVQDGIKKISCKYMAISQTKAREVTFKWISPDNPADNRIKTHTVKPGHISVYDFRYFGGRSEGKWTISATENDTNTTVSTIYTKDSNENIKVKSKDPLLRQ